MRIDVGPGYRVCFLQRGTEVVILLAGGEKSTQVKDVAAAKRLAKQVGMATKLKLKKWDSAEHLESAADIALLEGLPRRRP